MSGSYSISGIGALRLDAIPAELKGLPRWVAWTAVDRGDGKKATKIPVNPATGGNAMSDNPSTWGSFDAAVSRATKDALAGIGLMFGGDEMVGVDLDDVWDSAAGKFSNPLAEVFVRSMDTYTEVSPSGNGVKMWLRSSVPPGKCTGVITHSGVSVAYETYHKGRWFAVTGHVMPQYGNGAVQERTAKYSRMLELGAKSKPKKKANPDGKATAVVHPTEAIADEEAMLRAALTHIDADAEGTWFRMGCCLKAWGAGSGGGDSVARSLWDEWSKTSSKFDPSAQDERWERMEPGKGLTAGTIFKEAGDEGYCYGDAIGADGAEYAVAPEGLKWTIELDGWHKDWALEFKAVRMLVASVEERILGKATAFPAIISAVDLVAEPDDEPPQVIQGVLHQGSKAVYGGPSKAFKSWTLIDLAIAVAAGENWLGFRTSKGRVLYINLELQRFAVRKRIYAVAQSRLIEVPPLLDVWNLRGYACPIRQITDALRRKVECGGYSLICPDPIYKALAGMDENSAGDIAAICNEIEQMAVQTGAAVVWGAHYAKGNASAKEAIDRISGSGVWARDPDAIITATAHEQDDAYTMDMTLRNFPQPEPFVVTWEYPRMARNDTLDPLALKRPKTGRTPEHQLSDILDHVGDGIATGAWQKRCTDETGMSSGTFYRLLKQAKKESLIRKDDRGCWVR